MSSKGFDGRPRASSPWESGAKGNAVFKLSDKSEIVRGVVRKQKRHAAINQLVETAGRGAVVTREVMG